MPDNSYPDLTSLSFPTVIDLVNGAVSIVLQAGATDPSGIDRVVLKFNKPILTQNGAITSFTFWDSADSFADGTSSYSATISASAALGVYNVDEIYVYDKTGNAHAYGPGVIGPTFLTIVNSSTPMPVISVTTQSASGSEGGSGVDYTITRTGDLSHVSSVSYAVAGASPAAAVAADFAGGVLPAGVVSFAAGESTKIIHVGFANDSTNEPDETFVMDISSPTGATLGSVTRGFGTIVNDDAGVLPTISLGSGWFDGTETLLNNNTPTFVVTRSGDLTGSSSVAWAVTGTGAAPANGADFLLGVLPSGMLTFAPGEASKTITVGIANDAVVEPDESFALTLSGPVNATLGNASTTSIIRNDDTAATSLPVVEFKTTDLTGSESGAGLDFVLTRTGVVSGASIVSYSVNGISAARFSASSILYGNVTFAAGETSKSIHLDFNNDGVVEAPAPFNISLYNAIGAVIGPTSSASGTIVDDDDPATAVVQLLTTSNAIAEFGWIDYFVTRTGDLTKGAFVRYTVTGAGSSPASAADFGGQFPSGQLYFAPGETTKRIELGPFTNDGIVEAPETFLVKLDSTTGVRFINNQATGTIYDHTTTLPRFEFLNDGPNVLESYYKDGFDLIVRRIGDLSYTSAVDWGTTGYFMLPVDKADFKSGAFPSGHLVFAPGEETKAIHIDLIDDAKQETDEVVAIYLANPTQATLGQGYTLAFVRNDDADPLPPLTAKGEVSLSEGNSGQTPFVFIVERGGDLSGTAAVRFTVVGEGEAPATASDFVGNTMPTGVVQFAAGQWKAAITVAVLGDVLAEATERFRVQLSDPVGAVLGQVDLVGVIKADDADPSAQTIKFFTSSVAAGEGADGVRPFSFTVTRSGLFIQDASVVYSVVGVGDAPADRNDFAGGVLPSGVIKFTEGQTSQTIIVLVAGDTAVEADEKFQVVLSSPDGAVLGAATADGLILNDDLGGPIQPPPAMDLTSAYRNILRLNATGAEATWLNGSLIPMVTAGLLTPAQATAQIIAKAGATTSVATLAYEFFTGSIPSQGGLDYLVSPTGGNSNNLNSAYYQGFSLENRYINFAVNLGKEGAGRASFELQYGSKDLFEATKAAYATIFGVAPTDAKIHALIDTRVDYFAAYGQDGPNGIGTKAAMVGWLLAEAEKADIGLYAKSNDAFLTDLADGAVYGVDIVGVYGRPEYSNLG